ncbi:Nuclear pore complex protein Nup93 [Nymphon striatum]|nr:Nuclear pore complex protein Nup93 [Nymphon striatum]
MADTSFNHEAGFTDLLQQAEQLTADMNGEEELPRVKRSLRQIMEVGEQLWTKTAHTGMTSTDATTDVRASILLGSKGIDLPRMSQKLEALSTVKTFEPIEPIHQADIQGFLKNERENAILSVIEESSKTAFKRAEKLHWQNLENEWEQEKQKILNALHIGRDQETLNLKLDNEMTYQDSYNLQTSSSLNNVEVAYARQVMLHNENIIQGGIKENLCKKFHNVALKLDDKNVEDLWTIVSSMCNISPSTGKDILAARTSVPMQNAFINQARQFLEKKYIEYIKTTISSNLQKAQLGGVPGTFHLIKSFLNVKLTNNYPGLEDGSVDGQPVWPIIYFCLRCGDLSAALQAVSLAGTPLKEFSVYLKDFMNSEDRRLTPANETKIKLEYRRSVRSSTDPFKRIVYCIIGCCDVSDYHSEVADKTEDFLWLCLCLIRLNSGVDLDSTLNLDTLQNKNIASDKFHLAKLQKMVLEDYGESHFNAFQQPFLYFQVLFLTAQFEAAIDFLARIEYLRCHAVHVAITLYQLGLLAMPVSTQATLLSKYDGDSLHRLNFAKLVMMYTRKFESTDPVEALHYFYFLRDLKNSSGEDLFMSCVSELVLETREFDMLLGKIEYDSCRIPGAIDKFCNDVGQIIEVVAADSEKKGQFEDAIKLYDLAKKHDKVLELMNELLSQVVAQPKAPQSKRNRLQTMAIDIVERYKRYGHNASKERSGTFYLLIDLSTFFDFYYSKNLMKALNVMLSIQLIPFQEEEVEERVNNFRHLPDEVRRNLPDVLLATMNILYTKYTAAKNSKIDQHPGTSFVSDEGPHDMSVDHYRKRARALITFAGMIPYRMPGDTNASLVQLEVLMN